VLELVKFKSRFEKIEVKADLQCDLPDVLCDSSGMRQVCLNLLMNAHQAIKGSGVVEITTKSPDPATVIFQIRDSGCGIPKEILDQIWDPFFTTKEVGRGLGLGLAITYSIIQRHGGDIRVESHIGTGSKFTVRMPTCQK